MQLILASRSPYRQELLARLGVPFICVTSGIDETPLPGEQPASLAMRLATAKAAAVVATHPDSLVIGADQVATINGTPIGKPGTLEKAREQLHALSGQTVLFHSAVCLANQSGSTTENVQTSCLFRQLSHNEIDNYLRREQVLDTAGSAKAEGLGIALMDAISSDDPTAIIGLPLITVSRLLRQFSINPLIQPE